MVIAIIVNIISFSNKKKKKEREEFSGACPHHLSLLPRTKRLSRENGEENGEAKTRTPFPWRYFWGISLGSQQLLGESFTLALTTMNSFIMGRCVVPIPLILGSGEDSSLSQGNCDALLWVNLSGQPQIRSWPEFQWIAQFIRSTTLSR